MDFDGLRVLHLTLKKQWFDMVESGEKLEEYREIKPYWDVRLAKNYDVIKFRNGYSKDSPVIIIELNEVFKGFGLEKWGAPRSGPVYILKLGKILR